MHVEVGCPAQLLLVGQESGTEGAGCVGRPRVVLWEDKFLGYRLCAQQTVHLFKQPLKTCKDNCMICLVGIV